MSIYFMFNVFSYRSIDYKMILIRESLTVFCWLVKYSDVNLYSVCKWARSNRVSIF